MILKLFTNNFESVEQMLACGAKHSVLADTNNHPFVVDCEAVIIHTLHGVVRYLDASLDDADGFEGKEVTASQAIKLILNK